MCMYLMILKSTTFCFCLICDFSVMITCTFWFYKLATEYIQRHGKMDSLLVNVE